jgi:hypothetical protein
VLVVVGVAAFAAAPGAASQAPPSPATVTLTTSPIVAKLAGKRYRLRIEATSTAGKSIRTVRFTFTRTEGSGAQEQSYGFRLPRTAFSCLETLSRCRLATGRSLGRFGRVDLTFVASGRRRSVAVGAGCTGTATRRPGAVTGSIAFGDRSVSLRVSSHFGKRTRLGTALDQASVDCSASRANCTARLFGVEGDPASTFALFVPATGATQAQFLWTSASRPATVERSITYRNVRAANYAIASDLTTASFNAQGLQFLSGSVAYTASSPVREFASRCGQATATLGGVTGDVAAVFDGVGRRPLAATGGYLESLP